MKNFLASLLAGSLIVAAPTYARADHVLARQDFQPGAEPQVFGVDQHDRAMKQAVHEARRTVGVFIKALQHPTAGQYDYQVKKPFHQGDVVEHIWLTNVTFKGNRFCGYVDNRPRKIKGLKMGDHVSVNPNEISDWAYVEKGRLIGGYTIRVLYWDLSPERRAAFEREAQFRIGSSH